MKRFSQHPVGAATCRPPFRSCIILCILLILVLVPGQSTYAAPMLYNAQDVDKLQTFLLYEEYGTSNASRLGWDALDPETWAGAEWDEEGGEQRLARLDISYSTYYARLYGSLDLSGCEYLRELSCDSAYWITELDVSTCTSLKELSCRTNDLISLNLSGCNAL